MIESRESYNKQICKAFESIEPSGLLAWSSLDQKSEKFITVALVAQLNQTKCVARSEYKRIDLVLVDGWKAGREQRVLAAYEAKCEILSHVRGATDGKPLNKSAHRWSGGCLASDLKNLLEKSGRHAEMSYRGGLFYLIEVSPGSHLKYNKDHKLDSKTAWEVVEECVGKKAVMYESSKKAKVPGTDATVQFHLAIFDADRVPVE